MQETIGQFTEFRSRLDDFERRIHETLNERMTSVLASVQRYRDEVGELQSRQRMISERFSKLQSEEEALQIERDTFKKDADETKNKLQEFEQKKRRLESQRVAILEESTELDVMLEKKELEIREQKERLIRQRQRDNPELKLYERLLGMQIDASQPGTLHFEFRQFDDQDMARSCGITLDVSSEDFAILRSTPELDDEDAKRQILELLNKHGDIASFLVRSRLLLISRAQRGQ